jgi:hypothetical protein
MYADIRDRWRRGLRGERSREAQKVRQGVALLFTHERNEDPLREVTESIIGKEVFGFLKG